MAVLEGHGDEILMNFLTIDPIGRRPRLRAMLLANERVECARTHHFPIQ